jgi:DNA-binding LacI/PurR family transcriptional regulator
MGEPRRITHRDIARKYGCDRSTVSLALSGHPRISPEVRASISALAERMGYRPDPSLSLLARHRFANRSSARAADIAYLVDSREASYDLQIRHFRPASQRAQQRGYRVFEFDLADYPSGDAASNVLFHRGVRGLIIPTLAPNMGAYFADPGWNRFTAVCCSVGWVRAPFHIVTNDIFEGVRLVWRETVKRGYRRIGAALFRHTPVAEDDFARYGASVAQQEELVPPRRRLPFLRCDPFDREAFFAWLRRHKPDAIISFISRPYEWLREARVRVPEDIAFVCCNSEADYAMSGLSKDTEELGEAALDFLVAQIHDQARGIPAQQQIVQLQRRWVEGATLPFLPHAQSPVPAPVLARRR